MPKEPFSARDWVPDPGVEHLVYETPWLNFYYDDIVHPTGETGKYAWVRSHSGEGAVMVVPVTPSEKFLLIKSYRHPSKQYLWEFPAGVMEPGEEPIESAWRELVEETGITPNSVEMMGSQIPIAGFTGLPFHSLIAKIPEISLEDVVLQGEEGIVDAKLLGRRELLDFLNSEKISDGVTLASVARYLMHQELKVNDTTA
ncbi:NUDIX hydrolase [Candidatus Lucifugimonas marina]|jgi:ADP-ribose pyrophosphatase|uniref:NUDIX domain-containing protein n=1 Tax=Candidatus Lucifugimonas marina TaxID=3038979 RepID=A0AAJ6CTQ0_9CHLR|nr:NUDIX domain-containing protein [SAR202 cluster bacterium JH639]WFG35889.1 NUDIX domain-containing protein [SAR202 cluster bacterium JH545]WFG39832.1 NUDIX domain-containing protein [SAR202 cluster bacterium JH1073]